MACANKQNPDCKNCNKSGLAILPVRYAVVPPSVSATLPTPLGHKVSNVPLSHHHYALRTLRTGYVYIYHEKHPRGSQITWEVYSVAENGTLWKQLSTDAIQPTKEPACSRTGHNFPASLIAIEKPEKCKRVWIAFSEHAWSEETFKLFASDAKLRDKRMQTFLPATWIGAKGYRHGLEGTQANVEKVLEYQDIKNASSLLGEQVTDISKGPDGNFYEDKLKKQTTRHPFHSRQGQSKQITETMKQVSERANGEPLPPIIIALWDSVGITQELNGYRNEPAGWIEKYGQERELEIKAMNAIEGVKKALEDKTMASANTLNEPFNTAVNNYVETTKRRADAANLPEPQRSQELEVCAILDGWKKRAEPPQPQLPGYYGQLNSANQLPEPRRSAEISRVKAEADAAMAQAKQQYAINKSKVDEHYRRQAAKDWQKYQDKLDNKFYERFKQNYDKFLAQADSLIDARTDDLIAWLKSKWLVNAMTEFNANNIDDGIVFDDQVGTVMMGIGSSIKGKAQLDAWVKEMKATEDNLLWRAIALNQEAGMADLNAALQEAEQHQTQRTQASAINWINYGSKSLKAFADTYKKATSTYDSNTEAVVSGNFHKMSI